MDSQEVVSARTTNEPTPKTGKPKRLFENEYLHKIFISLDYLSDKRIFLVKNALSLNISTYLLTYTYAQYKITYLLKTVF